MTSQAADYLTWQGSTLVKCDNPTPVSRRETGFYRVDSFRLKGRIHQFQISDELLVRVTTRKPDVFGECQEIREITAEICTKGTRERIGYIRGKVFRLADCELSSEDIFWSFDSIDQEGCDFAGDVVIKNQVDLYDLCEFEDFFVLELIEILPARKGGKVGISALKSLLSHLRAPVCFLKPQPLQFDFAESNGSPCPEAWNSYARELGKLLAYYRTELGATQVAPGSEYFYFRLSQTGTNLNN